MTPNSKLIVIIVIAIDTNTAPKILDMLNDFRIMLTNIMLQRIQSLVQDKNGLKLKLHAALQENQRALCAGESGRGISGLSGPCWSAEN